MRTTWSVPSSNPTWPNRKPLGGHHFRPSSCKPALAPVFGFPLRIGAVRIGALGLHRDEPGPLTNDEHADALVVADVATRAVLTLQTNASPSEIATEIETGANLRLVVHQACGMVAVQLGISLTEALIPAPCTRVRRRPSYRRGRRRHRRPTSPIRSQFGRGSQGVMARPSRCCRLMPGTTAVYPTSPGT